MSVSNGVSGMEGIASCFHQYIVLFCCVVVPNLVWWELSTRFLFIVLDSKAPKSEDIDEEDDDVPGKHIHFYVHLMHRYLIHTFKYLALEVIVPLNC